MVMTLSAHTIQDSRVSAVTWSIIGSAAAVVCVSAFEVPSFSFSKIAILIVAAFVATLLAGYRLKIPRTESIFYPKTVFAFWGTALLGIYGGALLALVASIADNYHQRKNDRVLAALVSRDVICAFASAIIFQAVANYLGGETQVRAGGFLIANEIVFASIVMAAAYFVAGVILDALLKRFEDGIATSNSFEDIAIKPITGHVASLAVSVALFLVFNHFGIEFGLVLLPLAIAANVGYKIHTLSLEQKTREIMEASRIHIATVEALATAIDARDQVGVGHVRRTQIYAVGLGEMLGLSDSEIEALRTAALLHDIGKLAVPDHILNKPGSLTQAEMEKTKIHSSVGASILEKVGFTTPVVPTVKYHHEFWDGSGYPEGLRGTQIPLTARVLSVADAYDTLRGARPYRAAISRDDTCNFMRAGAGSQFDPKIVDMLIRNLRHFDDLIAAEGLSYETESDEVRFDTLDSHFIEQIKRANREVFTLYSLARDFGAALTLEQTLALFTDKVGEFVPYDACAIFMLDDTGEFATVVHSAGESSAFLKDRIVRVGEGATGYALKKQNPVENVDPALDFAFTTNDEAKKFKTMVSLPLVAEDKVIGAISLYSAALSQYQDEHFRLLETVSRIATDAIAKSKQHAETSTYAHTDPITGLPNTRYLRMEFDKEVKRSIRSDSPFQVMMLDLDGFKAVNDNFGHKVGDAVLTAIGGVIRDQLREYDFLARYAGDEFVALIPETTVDEARELARRIEQAVSSFAFKVGDEKSASVGVSIGTAAYPNQGESFDQLIISADQAMYETKASHKEKAIAKEQPKTKIAPLEELMNPEATAEEYVPAGKTRAEEDAEENDGIVVELDERHVITTDSIH